MRRSTLGWCLALVLAALATATAGGQQAFDVEIASVVDGDYPEAVAVVNIIDASGEEAVELSSQDFRVTLDGRPASVFVAERASSQDDPLDLLFVFDVSGSMAGEPLAAAQDAARAFLQELGPNDRVGVISFGDDVHHLLEYTTDRAAIAEAIDGLEPHGHTALYQATVEAVRTASASEATRRVIILLSDGADSGTVHEATRETSTYEAAVSGVPIYAVGEGDEIDVAYLAKLAEVTTGRYLEAPEPEALLELYAGIGRLLRSQYVVKFDSSSVKTADPVPLMITVDKAGHRATADTNYRARSGLTPIVTVQGLADGEAISGARDILVTVDGRLAVERIAIAIDGQVLEEAQAAAALFRYDPAALGEGQRTLTVTVEAGGETTELSRTFTASVAPASALPLVPIAAGAGVLLLLAVIAAGVALLRRRAGRPMLVPVDQRVTPWATQVRMRSVPPPGVEEEEDTSPVEVVEEPLGKLIARAGPDLGSEYVIGGKPVSIGSGRACAVRIDDPELAAEEARAWVRAGHLMVHRMTRLSVIAADGVSGGWTILEPGDTFEVGEHRYEFRMLEETQPADDAGVVPNVLRDPEPPRIEPGAPGFHPQPQPLAHLQPQAEVQPEPDPQPEPQPERPSLIDLMPIGDPPPADEPDQRAAS